MKNKFPAAYQFFLDGKPDALRWVLDNLSKIEPKINDTINGVSEHQRSIKNK